MNTRHLAIASLFYYLFAGDAYATVSSVGPGYTADFNTNTIYSINLQTGVTSPITTIAGSNLVDISLLNKNTAYTLGNGDNNVYAINLQNNSYSRVTPTPLPSENLYGLAVANNNTAYVVAFDSNKIYSVNLQTGAYSSVATVPGSPGLSGIAMLNNTTAYAVGFNNNQVYLVNLQTGTSSVVTTLPGAPAPEGIALADSTTAYVVGDTDGTLRVVNLQTGASSIVATISGNPALEGVAISDTTAYTVSDNFNDIYTTNLLNGHFSILTSISEAAALNGMAILLQMPLQGLHGNNLSLANYLNANAPIDMIREFALLPNGLKQALESAAPTRNAFATYASQNAFLAASQALADHSRQKRFHLLLQESEKIAAIDIPTNELLALASNEDQATPVKPSQVTNESCKNQAPYTIWLTPFGEYAREKPKQQTPGFNIGLGGALLAFEWNDIKDNVVGCGAVYAYSHVHQENGAGHANVNQGFLNVYGTLNAGKFYFDMGLWGGYYHSNNQRKISFPGVDETARSNTHGWQLAPHLEVGYDGFWMKNCVVNWFGVEPFLMADWVANWEHGLQERGAGDLNMGQKGRFCSLIRGESGLRFHEIAQFSWGKLVFREKGSYAYQKAFHTGRLTAFLVGSPGSFVVDTLSGAQNLGVFEFSMLFISANTKAPYIDLRYQGEFGSRYQSHQGMLEIGKVF